MDRKSYEKSNELLQGDLLKSNFGDELLFVVTNHFPAIICMLTDNPAKVDVEVVWVDSL